MTHNRPKTKKNRTMNNKAQFPNPNFWSQKRVLITGHTGFKGSWLSCWLKKMGAEVVGYSLPPATTPSLYNETTQPREFISGDITDREQTTSFFTDFAPEIVFHLAAQALVRESYNDPTTTFATNVIGTQNILEAVRKTPSIKVVINITSDKVYENREWHWGYRENDALGGFDPYSASKACADILATSYRRSFFNNKGCRIITARAGNVIGGGDWSADRLIPDAIRSFEKNEPLTIRSPAAVRPWQHVVEPLCGYLLLAENSFESEKCSFDTWNFGPDYGNTVPVSTICGYLQQYWGDSAKVVTQVNPETPHEAGLLKLDSSRAVSHLNWQPILDIKTTLKMTVNWYKNFSAGADATELVLQDIDTYLQHI